MTQRDKDVKQLARSEDGAFRVRRIYKVQQMPGFPSKPPWPTALAVAGLWRKPIDAGSIMKSGESSRGTCSGRSYEVYVPASQNDMRLTDYRQILDGFCEPMLRPSEALGFGVAGLALPTNKG